MRACVRAACVRARARVCVCVCVCVLNMTHVLRVYVCGRSRGGREGRECESEIYTFISFTFHFILFHFNCTFLSLESMCQRKIFIFMLYILMNNKDLFDLI